MSKQPKIGFHAPIAGGLQNALIKSRELDCDTVQIFSRNPRGWAAKPLTEAEIFEFKKTRRRLNINPIAVHCNYLVNLAAADDEIRSKSISAFREEVVRCLALKADYLVVHPGSAKGASEDDGVRICAESLKKACDGLDLGRFRILLENTAGQGACIGHRFEHLGTIMRECKDLNLGVCFDTAHAFTAGYDIREEDGFKAAMQALEKYVGSKNVRAVHFNDSRADYNSRVDRHWHIGLGKIGIEGLRRVARHPGFSQAAFILETPQEDPTEHLLNVDKLRSYVS